MSNKELQELIEKKARECNITVETMNDYLAAHLIHPILHQSVQRFITGSTEEIRTIKVPSRLI